MKIFLFLMISCCIALSSLAQYSDVTLKVNGHKNRKVVLDGKTYTMSNTNAKANNKNITISNVQAGQHTIQVFRTDKKTNTAVSTFTIKDGYDIVITVNGTGKVLIKEKKQATAAKPVTDGSMSAANFTSLLQNVQAQWQAGTKLNMISNAFSNPANFFTSTQAKQLIQLIDAEDTRLQLAKASYRSIVDPGNFNIVYSLLADKASKNALSVYISNYNSTPTGTSAAMSTADFNKLVQDIQNQWQAGAKFNMINNAFINTGSYFTTAQAKQLVQMVDAESSRLQLAKASYRSIIDPSNFSNIFLLLTEQASKNELSAYVANYNNSSTNTHVAMNAANFSKLLNDVQNQWQAAAKLSTITNAFNANDYFTAAQARQLIQTVDAESSRLQLAKLAYKTITDVANYNTVSELLATEASRNELAAFIRNGYDVITPSEGVKTAMSDANFQSIIKEVQSQWIPGTKMLLLQDIFANTSNYFSTVQVRQLVSFVSQEPNRLQLLKASYKNLTDRVNFSSLYDLLPTQASRDELTSYVRSNG